MSEKDYKIVGLGEVLFDLLPEGKELGGTTANFAHVVNQLGDCGVLASRVGNDEYGREAINKLKASGVDANFIQIDKEHPTGAVKVTLNDGQPSYEVIENVAWDHLEFTEAWKDLAGECDAVCYGTLGQRNSVSKKTILAFIKHTRTDALKVFDVNLRQNFYTNDTLLKSLKFADAVKLNHEELPIVMEACGLNTASELDALDAIRRKFELKVICLTRGANGSFLVSEGQMSEHPGIEITVADTIGAGDSFTATMAHGLLRNWDLDEINDKSNKVAAFVASHTGAMPSFKDFKFS